MLYLKERFKRILVIKLSSLGDVIHSLPVLQVLKYRWPDAHISWAVNSTYSQILSGHPLIDRVILFQREKWGDFRKLPTAVLEILAFYSWLRAERFDLAIDLQGLFKSGAMAFFSGAPMRVGLANAREFSHLFYNQRIELQGEKMHAVDRYFSLVSHLVGGYSCPPEFLIPEFQGKDGYVQRFFSSHNMNEKGIIVAVCPWARWQSKRWPLENFRALIDKLIDKECQVVLIGGPEDQKVSRNLISGITSEKIVSMVGQSDLKQLAAILEKVKVLVTNDTGPMHLAAAVGTPVVALFGPTSPELTGPYGKTHRVIQSSVYCSPCFKKQCASPKCLWQITVEDVYSAVLSYM